MFNKTDHKNQEFMTSLMQYMSKPYIKNPEAFQLAWKSSVFCTSDFGKIFNREEIANGIRYKLELGEAVQKLASYDNHLNDLESVLDDFSNKGESIVIKVADLAKIKSKPIKTLIAKVMDVELEEIRAEEA